MRISKSYDIVPVRTKRWIQRGSYLGKSNDTRWIHRHDQAHICDSIDLPKVDQLTDPQWIQLLVQTGSEVQKLNKQIFG